MLKIEWRLGYANNPSLVVEESLNLLPREECEFEFKEGMWWHIQKNGLVRYFAHSGADRNEGGYGGACFDILHNGERRTIKGPWSSRASYLNTLLSDDQQVADIRLINHAQYPTYCGILVSELVKLWDQEAYLLRAKAKLGSKEHGGFTASLAPDCILKPDNVRYDPAYEYEIFAEPVKG